MAIDLNALISKHEERSVFYLASMSRRERLLVTRYQQFALAPDLSCDKKYLTF
mgnify:CR=1 FL=1